jgi:6-pyruvoyl-tetrahydropterin synthase-like protein
LATEVIKLPVVELAPARARARWLNRWLTVATFAGIYLVLVNVLHLDLIFSATTAAGGDMGSHHYVATFLRTDLLPRGRVSGWAPGWYAGIPMLTFYFPLPYTLIALLAQLIGDQVAFKLVSASGLFLLPVSTWGAFKVLRLPEPAPLLAAVAALPFLVMTSYTIYGGNIASTMAGEFPFALSFALLPLCLAVLWRVVEDGRWSKRATVLVAVLVLSHILTTIVLCLSVLILLVRPRFEAFWRSLGRLARVFALAFCLTAFWSLPFIFRVPYTAHFRWTQLTDLKVLAPGELRPYLVFSAIAVVVALRRGERRILLFVWPVAVAALAFAVLARFAPQAAVWNARMLPFLYLFLFMLAAWGATLVVGWLGAFVQRVTGVAPRVGYVGLVVLLVAVGTYASWAHRSFLPYWARYNYEGFEVKPGWPEAEQLFATLDRLPEGRVMWEFSRDYERFGTTRTLENIPVFTRQPTMEGLLIESSLNAPFHFINQAETSETATQAVPGIDYPAFDFKLGLRHLQLYGVRYYVAYSDKVKAAAKAAKLKQVATSGRFRVYELGDGHLVEVPPLRPVLSTDPDWRARGLEWYRRPASLDTPLVFAPADDAAARRAFASQGASAALPREPLARPGTIASEQPGPEEIRFHTDRVGEPHIVKVSWFPNWRAEGAQGPWMLSPGLMVVVPTQSDVRLVYRDTPFELGGRALTLLGIAVMLGWVAADLWRRRSPPDAVVDPDEG